MAELKAKLNQSQAALLCAVVLGVGTFHCLATDLTFSDANWIGTPGVTGVNSVVFSAAADTSGNFYVGGQFGAMGDASAANIAKWDGRNWSPLGSGIGGTVYALAASGADVYAGGDFKTAGSTNASHIARWDGSSWRALGDGVRGGYPGHVNALAVSSSNLYVGGSFTTAGAFTTVNYVAKWDGSNWSALGSGMNLMVRALAVSGTNLYAGGNFTTAGGSPATNIARWNGSGWSALGSGTSGYVLSLATLGSDLYAGGFEYIVKWDGNSWSGVGSGMAGRPGYPASVLALAVSSTDVYAAGDFIVADGSPANHIARWDGNGWSALGSGVNDRVYSLAISGSDLFAGGYFRIAGGKVSAFTARAYLLSIPALSVRPSGANVLVSWPSADTSEFALEEADMPTLGTWVTNAASISDDGTNKSVSIPATNGSRMFRLRRP